MKAVVVKASSLVLLLAAQLCWMTPAGATALADTALSAWSNLWRTPDQQGQALLDAGKPAEAAERFRDPRRRAYADLRAGRYGEAAKLLEPFTDAQSEYNRGNALAKAGELQAALAAYDAALKQAPADKDVRHNRDLVERALRQRRQSSQSSSRNGGQQGQKSGSSGQQQSAAGQQGGSGSNQSGASGQQSAGAGQTASNGSQTGGNRPGSPSQQQPGQNGTGATTDTSKEAPGQAQRDAAAAAALARQQQRGKTGKAGNAGQTPGDARPGSPESGSKGGDKRSDAQSLIAGGTQTPRQKPESERQLALDQWLRQIPDSPAGLLQRKFLIEHMMREQESDGTQGDGP
jgi:Ca-activated chloride channel family protein